MKLQGLTLPTVHFEDYLSFLTEVLELELAFLHDDSMVLDLMGTTLIITKTDVAPQHNELQVHFELCRDEYESLMNKISFFTYRKGVSLFQISPMKEGVFALIDPDGRRWCFSHTLPSFRSNTVANL